MNTLIEQEFGLAVEHLKHLNGYDNKNYKISTKDRSFVFKTYVPSQELHDIITAENETLQFLSKTLGEQVPAIIPFADQSSTKSLQVDGQPALCRMLSFLEGRFLGEAQHTVALFQSIGTFLAALDLKLGEFKQPSLQARQWEWDLQYFDLNRPYMEDIDNSTDRNMVRYFFQQFEEVVRPVFPKLRKQIIHNDANEWNLLVQDDQVSGIIDFGDLAHSFLINEVAIAITYGCYDKEEPLEWATVILEAYHQTLPLQEQEIAVLYYLIAARLCTSVCNSAHAKKADPGNTYASVSEANAWKMLYKWLTLNPIRVESVFRKAIGLPEIKASGTQHLVEKRARYFSKNLSTSYQQPIHMTRAAFQYMYDAAGNTFLDAYNNIPHVGHSHPKVVQAGQRQMAQLNTNTRYLYHELVDYAEQLLSRFPDSLSKVFFVNSGSAASDLAIRLAQHHTRAKQVMVMEAGYHGNTQTSIEISDYKFNHPKGEGQKDHILTTPLPNSYIGTYAGAPNAGMRYGQDAVRQIQHSTAPIAAFICEPIVGCAGQIPLAEGYLKEVYPAIRAQNGVCISDEVQTGFGRLGTHFWGYEAQEVVPDIVVLGKPIANGHPMGAVVCTEAIATSFEQGVEFFSSFGGNPVSTTIAQAVLEVIEEEGLQENARIVGDHYQNLLKRLQTKHASIGDVRGMGLFIGVEIVQLGSTAPDTALAQVIKNGLRERHILVSTDGPHDNVIKTKPPLCFTKENAAAVVQAMNEVLNNVGA